MSLSKRTEKYKRLVKSERFQDKLKRITLPGFEGIPIYDVVQRFREEIKRDDLSIRASSISYYFILALFPTIIFFFSLVPYIPIRNLDTSIMHGFQIILPNRSFLILESTISDIIII